MKILAEYAKFGHFHQFQSLILALANSSNAAMHPASLSLEDCQAVERVVERMRREGSLDYEAFIEEAHEIYLRKAEQRKDSQQKYHEFVDKRPEELSENRGFYQFLFARELGVSKQLITVDEAAETATADKHLKMLNFTKTKQAIELLAETKPDYCVRHYFDAEKQVKSGGNQETGGVIAVTRRDSCQLLARDCVLGLNKKRYVYSFLVSAVRSLAEI